MPFQIGLIFLRSTVSFLQSEAGSMEVANLQILGAKKPLTQPNRCWDARATQSTFNTGQQPFGPKLFKGSFRSLRCARILGSKPGHRTTFKRKEEDYPPGN